MPKTKPTDEIVEDSDVTVEFNGSTFTIPRSADDWPTVAWLARLEAESTRLTRDWLRFVELLLGQKQWDHLVKVAATRRADLTSFVDALVDAILKECAL